MNKKLIAVFILIFVISLPLVNFAQGGIDPGCDPADPTCPIDGGISLLIAAGLGVGARQMMRKKAE